MPGQMSRMVSHAPLHRGIFASKEADLHFYPLSIHC
jgi:hypothetical protein